MFEAKNPLHKNIEIIAKAMNWEDYPFITSGSECFFTWKNKTQKDVDEIYEKTGIKCRLTQTGLLMVPEYNNFKSEKEKQLLLDLNQNGPTMFYLLFCKKAKPNELKTISETLFSQIAKRYGEEVLNEILIDVIEKIS